VKRNFLTALILTEVYKKKEDPAYKGVYDSYIASFPSDLKDYPFNYEGNDLKELDGSTI